METSQKRFLSKTVRAGLIGSVAAILSMLGIYTLDDELKNLLIETIGTGILLATSIMAIVWRFTAKKTIK